VIRTSLVGVALLLCSSVGSLAQTAPAPKPAPPKASQAPKQTHSLPMDQTLAAKTYTGDLDELVKRRAIRVLVAYNKTNYFIDKGVQRGITYDAFKVFEDRLNRKLKTGNLRIHVVFIPIGREALAEALLSGRGDVIAANITVSDARKQLVDFSEPAKSDVKEVIVTGPGAPAIAKLDDLAGQTVHVRKGSLYREHLAALSDTLVKQGKPPINVKELSTNLEDEDILEMTNAGLVKITVVDDYLANFWKQIFTAVNVHNDVAVASDQEVAFAIRKNSPKLKAELDDFVKANRLGTATGNVLFQKYLKSAKYVKASTSPAELAKFQTLIALFKKYGDQYGVDWLLMAAQGYQESGLNQQAKSSVGAIGVMQLMPDTGKDMKVGDIKQIEPNINAGVKYIRFMIDTFFADEPMDDLNKGLFAFAAYNAGPGRVKQLRREAQQSGLNPNIWFNNVERIASKRVGRETVQYVSNIYKYYIAYQLALEAVNERKAATPGTGQ
jgi:membrane-bound lytic murein transglycosylase MltF